MEAGSLVESIRGAYHSGGLYQSCQNAGYVALSVEQMRVSSYIYMHDIVRNSWPH
jgi:hypothetical protein